MLVLRKAVKIKKLKYELKSIPRELCPWVANIVAFHDKNE